MLWITEWGQMSHPSHKISLLFAQDQAMLLYYLTSFLGSDPHDDPPRGRDSDVSIDKNHILRGILSPKSALLRTRGTGSPVPI